MPRLLPFCLMLVGLAGLHPARAEASYCTYLGLPDQWTAVRSDEFYCIAFTADRPELLYFFSHVNVQPGHSGYFRSEINLLSKTIDRINWMDPQTIGDPKTVVNQVRRSGDVEAMPGVGLWYPDGEGWPLAELSNLEVITYQGFERIFGDFQDDGTLTVDTTWDSEFSAPLVFLRNEAQKAALRDGLLEAVDEYDPLDNPNLHVVPDGWCDDLAETVDALVEREDDFISLGAQCDGGDNSCRWDFDDASDTEMWEDFASTVLALRYCGFDHSGARGGHPFMMRDVALAVAFIQKTAHYNTYGNLVEFFSDDDHFIKLSFNEERRTLHLHVD